MRKNKKEIIGIRKHRSPEKSNENCGRFKDRKRQSWVYNIFIAFDQLGNAVSFGNPDSTISARVGFFSYHTGNRYIKSYWIFLAKIINWAFWPVDGKNHCIQAYCSDPYEKYFHGNTLAWLILSIFVLAFSLVIGIILYPIHLFFPCIQKIKCEDCKGEKGKFAIDQ